MPYSQRTISRRTRILFPIVVTILVGTLVPFATPLIGMLMLGNLMKESGVVERLTKASSQRDRQRRHAVPRARDRLDDGRRRVPQAVARSRSSCSASSPSASTPRRACCSRKLLNVLSGGKINPLIGAAGISAFPMAARVVQRVGAGGGLRELPADARDGRQRRRPGGERRRRRRAAGADGRRRPLARSRVRLDFPASRPPGQRSSGSSLTLSLLDTEIDYMSERPFRILGLQQIAIGGLDKAKLARLWVDTLGVPIDRQLPERARERRRGHPARWARAAHVSRST